MSFPEPEHEPDLPFLCAEPDAPPPEPGAPQLLYLQPPRLGIIHLLAWTAVAAVFLKFGLAIESMDAGPVQDLPPALSVAMRSIHAAFGVLHAAALVGCGTLLLARARGWPGRFQPGHWIVLLQSVMVLLSYFVWITWVATQSGQSSGPSDFFWLPLALGLLQAVYAAGYVLGASRIRDALRWRVGLIVVAIVNGLGAILYCLLAFGFWRVSQWMALPWDAVVVLLMLAAVLIAEWWRRARRDWVHWLGVATLGMGAALSLANRIVWMGYQAAQQ